MYVWIQLVAIQQAARPERPSITDTGEMEGTTLRGGLLVRRLRRLGQEELFSLDVDEDVAPVVVSRGLKPITSHTSTRRATDRKTLGRIGFATPLSRRL